MELVVVFLVVHMVVGVVVGAVMVMLVVVVVVRLAVRSDVDERAAVQRRGVQRLRESVSSDIEGQPQATRQRRQ